MVAFAPGLVYHRGQAIVAAAAGQQARHQNAFHANIADVVGLDATGVLGKVLREVDIPNGVH